MKIHLLPAISHLFLACLVLISLPVQADTRDISIQSAKLFTQQQRVHIAVGISNYNTKNTGFGRLKYAVKDAKLLANTFRSKGYQPISILDHNANKQTILNKIERAGKLFPKGEGTLIFSFSGHGYKQGGRSYLATYDAYASNLRGTGLTVQEVVQAIRKTGVRRAMLLLDACRNNPLPGRKSVATSKALGGINPGRGIQILYSTNQGSVSWEHRSIQQGVFSYFVNRALHGGVAARKGAVTFNDLAQYVMREVPLWTNNRLSETQQPYRGTAGEIYGDFVMVSKKINIARVTLRPRPAVVNRQNSQPRPQAINHYHGKKKHQHAFPKVGILHRHGQGIQGSRLAIEAEVFTPIATQADSVYEVKQKENKRVRDRLANNNRDLKGVNFGRYYALLIGNRNYSNFANIPTATNDVDAVASVLKSQYGFKTSILKNASQKRMLSAFNSFMKRLGPKDNLLIYYAGHGKLTGGGHWLPSTADKSNKKTWISNAALTNFIEAMKAKHVLVVADSCYSGTLSPSAIPHPILNSRKNRAWYDAVVVPKVRIVLSSGGVKPVVDSGSANHSVFANAFLTALRSGGSVMEGATLFQKLRQQVKTTQGYRQNPVYAPIKFAGHQAGDFVFLKGGRIH